MRRMRSRLAADERLDAFEIIDRAAAERYVAKVCFKTGPPLKVVI